mmetsp:Transcript_18449/g.28885  ORF Transcript_18449/g.28885 Transcript_18449/m.28885 type:complete len:111 (-) Transcript_18449:33-365(-)
MSHSHKDLEIQRKRSIFLSLKGEGDSEVLEVGKEKQRGGEAPQFLYASKNLKESQIQEDPGSFLHSTSLSTFHVGLRESGGRGGEEETKSLFLKPMELSDYDTHVTLKNY